MSGSEEQKTDEYDGHVNRIAANYHRVIADPRDGANVVLEIRLEGDESLHLIVDSERHDGGTGTAGSEKNVFRKRLKEKNY